VAGEREGRWSGERGGGWSGERGEEGERGGGREKEWGVRGVRRRGGERGERVRGGHLRYVLARHELERDESQQHSEEQGGASFHGLVWENEYS
jgi:hypothetical protein